MRTNDIRPSMSSRSTTAGTPHARTDQDRALDRIGSRVPLAAKALRDFAEAVGREGSKALQEKTRRSL